MRALRRTKIAFRLGLISGSIAVACLLILAGDYLLSMSRATTDMNRVDALVEQIKTDATVAPRLDEERDRQTAESLARKSRARIAAWVLLVAGVGFVSAGKELMAHRPPPLPVLDALLADRFPQSSAKQKKPRVSRADPPTGGTGIDLAFVDELVARFGSGREAAIPILQAIQDHFRYLPDEALHRVCERTEITPAQLAGTSSFYAQFRRSPVGRHVVRVCHGTACHVAGAQQITDELRRHLKIPPEQDTDPRKMFTLDAVACLGCCSLAPVMMVEEETAGHLNPISARQALDEIEPAG